MFFLNIFYFGFSLLKINLSLFIPPSLSLFQSLILPLSTFLLLSLFPPLYIYLPIFFIYLLLCISTTSQERTQKQVERLFSAFADMLFCFQMYKKSHSGESIALSLMPILHWSFLLYLVFFIKKTVLFGLATSHRMS